MITRVVYILLAVFFMIYVYRCVRKNIMTQDESILWMIGSLGLLILAIFPGIIIFIAGLIGIEYAPSLLFLLGTVFLLVLVFRNTLALSALKEKNKELIQNYAIFEKRIRDLEGKISKRD